MNTVRKEKQKITIPWRFAIPLILLCVYLIIAMLLFSLIGATNKIFQPEDKASLKHGAFIASFWGGILVDNFYMYGELTQMWDYNETHYWYRTPRNLTWIYKERYDVVK